MNFKDASKVAACIHSMDDVERQRGLNRLPVNRQFNGFPPLSEAEADRVGLDVNVDFKQATMLAQDAIGQYKSAFTAPGQYFTVTIENAPVNKRDEWSGFVTRKLKAMMTHPRSRYSRDYFNLWDNKAAAIVLHGPGIQQWLDPDCWCPRFVAIEDFRVPTDTNVSFDNLPWFAIRREYRPGEIYNKAFGKNAPAGWNKKALKTILKSIKDDNFRKYFTNVDWDSPEKWLEILKQNSGYFMSDAVLAVPFWDFYYLNEDESGWLRRCVCDTNTPGEQQDEWIFTSGEKTVAKRLSEILHMLPGDLNNKPPLKYHSMRSLGFTLVDPCFWQNITHCWLLHHTMMSFRPWFNVEDPEDRARQQFVDIGSSVNIPKGVSIVPWDQRHRIDPTLVRMTMAANQQVIGQASDTYTQEIDTGTQKERTAFEASALLNLKQTALQRMLTNAYKTENFAYVEICRRAAKKGSNDPDCRRFYKACRDYGITEDCLDVDEWTVEPVTTMVQGNDVLELQRAQMLMEIKPQLPPEGQDVVTFKYVSAVTKNPAEAQRITKLGEKPMVTDSIHDAQLAFGSLMQGVAVQPKGGFNPIEQEDTLLGMMQQFIERTQVIGAMEPEDTLGLNNAALYVQAQIQRIAADPREKGRVQGYSQQLGKLMNTVKAADQQNRQKKQAEQANGNGNGEGAAQLAEDLAKQRAMGQEKAQNRAVSFDQRARQKEEGFLNEQRRQEQSHQIDLRRQSEEAAVARVNDTLAEAQKRLRPTGKT